MRWVQLCGSLNIFWHCLSLGLEWKLTLASPVATAEFSKFAGPLSCSNFTASSFRIWNSSARIPPHPLILWCFPRAVWLLTPGISGSRWVIKPSWLSGSLRSFLYSSSVYSYHLFLISVLYCSHLCMKYSLLSLIFFKTSLVFPILLFFSNFLH